MKETFSYATKGTCSKGIEITVEDNVVTEVKFIGGCPGNTHGVAALAAGMTVDEVIARLEGIKCGPKPTSCPDQLATALKEHFSK